MTGSSHLLLGAYHVHVATATLLLLDLPELPPGTTDCAGCIPHLTMSLSTAPRRNEEALKLGVAHVTQVHVKVERSCQPWNWRTAVKSNEGQRQGYR